MLYERCVVLIVIVGTTSLTAQPPSVLTEKIAELDQLRSKLEQIESLRIQNGIYTVCIQKTMSNIACRILRSFRLIRKQLRTWNASLLPLNKIVTVKKRE